MHLPPPLNGADVYDCNLTVSELLLHALVIELEAKQRYEQFADMMRQSGNLRAAKIFQRMAAIEAEHAELIDKKIEGRELPLLTPSQFHWRGPEAPENTDSGRFFHLMTPCQAMELALDNERRAFEFFSDVVDDSTDECVREIAAELAVEEEQHVAWVEQWLAEEQANKAESGDDNETGR